MVLNNDKKGSDTQAIEAATLDWVQRVVIGLNLCPFASSAVKSDNIALITEPSTDMAVVLDSLAKQFYIVSSGPEDGTALFILQQGFDHFETFLDLVDLANDLLIDLDFEGHLQLATFHPQYQFSDSDFDDPANYTNRSPYPMLHLLQEAAVEKAVEKHPDTDAIPERNIALLREMGSSELAALVSKSNQQADQ